jgi:hypothetical protein
MENAPYYRGQAERARRLAHSLTNREVEALLERIAQDYDDIAVDLENGAIEVRHPELMPQSQDWSLRSAAVAGSSIGYGRWLRRLLPAPRCTR